MSDWRWAGQAVLAGVVCVLAGGAVGVAVAEVGSPVVMGLGITGFLLVAGFAAVNWVGAYGGWAVMLGLVAAVSVSTQWARLRFVRSVNFVEVTDSWPAVGDAVHFAEPLQHVRALEGDHTFNHHDGNRTTQVTQTAVPLVAKKGGSVLAFDCFSSRPNSRVQPDAAWVVLASSEPMGPSGGCEEAIDEAKKKILASGGTLAPGAEGRLVSIYPSYERFSETNMEGVLWVNGVLLLLYALGMVLAREKGALEAH